MVSISKKRGRIQAISLYKVFLERVVEFQSMSFERNNMGDDRKHKLIDLEAECLADALLELALQSVAADDLVERLIATPTENVQRFKKKLAALKRPRRFIGRRESFGFARQLEMLLQDLKAGITDPLTGVELVAAFYETDNSVIEQCDDSDGCVGDVFRYGAKELFAEFATRCADKEKIAAILLKLNRKDDYGVRDALIHCAGDVLPEPVIRTMISSLQQRAGVARDEYQRSHHLMLVESLARQIKDAELFEQTRIASWGKLSTAAFIDIGRVYLESGNVQTAYSWLKKVPENETYQAYERDKLQQEIYTSQGDEKKLTELLYRKFQSYHSSDTLQDLLDVIGTDKRDEIISKEVELILANPAWRETDAKFLLSVGKIKEAETLILERSEQIDGDYYTRLISLAETMESENRNLAATLIYRSLLISILERGYTKAYPHGVRYLKKLDKLAASIMQWMKFDNHESFKDQIHRSHGRKYSFWSKYE